MGILEDYRAAERQLAELQSALTKLGDDEQLRHELDFVEKFNALRSEYGYSLKKAAKLIFPVMIELPAKAKRAERRVTTYINPHTNERLDTRSGNNVVLRAWRKQYGADAVVSWKTSNGGI